MEMIVSECASESRRRILKRRLPYFESIADRRYSSAEMQGGYYVSSNSKGAMARSRCERE